MKKALTVLLVLALVVPALTADIVGTNNIVTLGDLMTDVYAEIAGFMASGSRYIYADSTLVINRINAACREIAEAGKIERDTTVTVVAGTENYALPYDFLMALWLSSKESGTDLEYGMDSIPGNMVGKHRADKGIPRFWRVDKSRLHIEPANNDGDSIIVHYGAYANVMDSTADTSNVDRSYRTAVASRASQMILQSKREAK